MDASSCEWRVLYTARTISRRVFKKPAPASLLPQGADEVEPGQVGPCPCLAMLRSLVVMIDTVELVRVVTAFHDLNDGAAMKSRELVSLLLRESPAPLSRDQYAPGHITCTGLVLDPGRESVLMVHHRRLNRWLLPGGHVEADDAEISDTARREVAEETGADLLEETTSPLAGIDVHGIPSNGREPYHLHHDLVFFFRARSNAIRASEESHAVAWVHPANFDEYNVPSNVRLAWERVKVNLQRR